MSVVCAACKTENRATAMFCRGCAAKLPGFAATGPSALEGMKPHRAATAPPAQASGPTPGMLPIETRAFWIRFAVLSVVVTACFGGWVAYVTRKPPPSTTSAVAAAPAPRVATSASIAPARAAMPPSAPLDRMPLEAASPVRMAEALGPRETVVEPGPVRSEPERPVASYQPATPVERTVMPKKIVARNGPTDPRPTCAHLNFIAAARCEAAQCARAPYNHHPHCDAVRAQTRRDVARRNPNF